MATLNMLCSIKLRSCNHVSNARLVTARKNLFLVSATNTMTPTTANVTYQNTKNLFLVSATNTMTPTTANVTYQNTMFQEFSRRSRKLVADQVLVQEHENYKVKTKTEAEVAEEEIGRIIQRLEAAVERVIELEIEKFMGRVKGLVSYEDGLLLVEEMSGEIVSKFLEKPIQYLRSSDGNLEEKIKELRLLACVLEESNTS